jgi:hypothetical protein
MGVELFAAVAVGGFAAEPLVVAPGCATVAGFAVDDWLCWATAVPRRMTDRVKVLIAVNRGFRITTIVSLCATSRKTRMVSVSGYEYVSKSGTVST